jgi:hypothetical protein
MKSLLIPCFLFLLNHALAQVSIVSTLNNTGNYTANGNIQLEWSAGELTSISIFNNGLLLISTGILQGATPLPTGVITYPIASNAVKLFPNPAQNNFNGSYSFDRPGIITTEIIGSNGVRLRLFTYTYSTGIVNEQYAVETLPAGTYLLKVTFTPYISTILQTGIYKLIIQR